ncbi:hypothetical protein WR25_10192 isoform B [Diploscapter pachys]|uniref:Uncharacterized protein n=1 Tax=Diploscapter pachys TaxID=2018661 RepID=A0A2A2KM91_9BILA|nr:hypothetical protein WR25_10192 isoform B [Diploscapter pachys]
MKSDDGQSNDTPRSSEPPPVLSPAPFIASTAALIAFDPKTRQVLVLDDSDFVNGVEKDSTIEHEGRVLTILEKCSSREEATRISKLKAASMGAIGVDGCNYEESNDSSCMDRIDGLDEEEEEEEDETDNTMVEISNQSSNMNPASQLSDVFDSSGGNGNAAFRELLTMVLTDIDSDIRKLLQRQQSLREVLIKHIGTGSDGRILETFEPRPERLFVPTSKATARPSSLPSQQDVSYLQRLIEQRGQKRLYNEDEEEVTIRNHFKRPRVEGGSQQTGSAQGVQIGRAGDVLRYPYVSKEIEEEIYQQCRDSSSLYAQKLGRLLFADSLHLYFKDQDPKRRQWIHEAVDFRFPSEDKASQLLKWKNARWQIHSLSFRIFEFSALRSIRICACPIRIMIREMEGRSPTLTCLPRSSRKSSTVSPATRSSTLNLWLSASSRSRSTDSLKIRTQRRRSGCVSVWTNDSLWRTKSNAISDGRSVQWPAIGTEPKCCPRMGLVRAQFHPFLFSIYEILEAEYPYFPQQKEEDCFKKAKGVPYVYAEEMAKLLFPTTSHLLFKVGF